MRKMLYIPRFGFSSRIRESWRGEVCWWVGLEDAPHPPRKKKKREGWVSFVVRKPERAQKTIDDD